MTSYRLGNRGTEVAQLQQRLGALGDYRGPIDGVFGSGTAAAVKHFQQRAGLAADGVVGDATWRAVFGASIASPALLSKPLDYRCLALTGAFETDRAYPECFAGLAGDFDGQGISFGVCQWNFGQGTLQPLLKDMLRRHRSAFQTIFGEHAGSLIEALVGDRAATMHFAAGIQHPQHHSVNEPWRGMFRRLGTSAEFQTIQQRHARSIYRTALKLAAAYGLRSQRGKALMFDILVQNGGIGSHTQALILADFAALPAPLRGGALELAKLRIVANRRAEAARPRWIADVRARKLCIAEGTGVVHGIAYNLSEQFGIGLTRQRKRPPKERQESNT